MAEVLEVLLGHPSGAWQSTSVSGSLIDLIDLIDLMDLMDSRTLQTSTKCGRNSVRCCAMSQASGALQLNLSCNRIGEKNNVELACFPLPLSCLQTPWSFADAELPSKNFVCPMKANFSFCLLLIMISYCQLSKSLKPVATISS